MVVLATHLRKATSELALATWFCWSVNLTSGASFAALSTVSQAVTVSQAERVGGSAPAPPPRGPRLTLEDTWCLAEHSRRECGPRPASPRAHLATASCLGLATLKLLATQRKGGESAH